MKNTLALKNPIMIDNQEVKELTYDVEEITPALFSEAEARKKMAAGTKNVAITPAVEFDFSLHLYLFFAAVVAVNPQYAFEDVARIHGRDLMEAMQVGRDFILPSGKSKGGSSDEQSEIIPEPTTQVSSTSKDKG